MLSIYREIEKDMIRPTRTAKLDAIKKISRQAEINKEEQLPKKQPSKKQPPKKPKKTLNLQIEQPELSKYQSTYFEEVLEGDDITVFDEKHKTFKDLYNPNDDIANDTLELLDSITHITLPDTFKSNIPLFEIKKEVKEQLKQKQEIMLDKLKDGFYHSAGSKSDKNISNTIKTWCNNLPSFKQYKTDNSLNYIITSHRLLFLEIIKHIKNNRLTLATFKTHLNTILRIYKLSYSNKHPVYNKYWVLLQSLSKKIDKAEGENLLSDIEIKRFLPFQNVIKKRDELYNNWKELNNKKTKTAYQLNQDLLLVGLYSYIPPLRDEIKTLDFTYSVNKEGDYIHIHNNGTIELQLNEIKKKHKKIVIELPQILQNLLKESFELYKRQSVFTDTSKYPDVLIKAKVKTLSTRLLKIFSEYGVNVGASSLRSSYVVYYLDKLHRQNQYSYNKVEELSKQMRTSSKMILQNYNKRLPSFIEDDNEDIEGVSTTSATPVIATPVIATTNKEPVLTAYQKKKENMRKYYENNKEDIKNKMRENRATPDLKFKRMRNEHINLLNSDDEYRKKMRKATLEKYNIKLVDGVYQ